MMGRMKIYIAGPMTGIPKWNFPAFFEAENQLLALGHEPVNPAHNDGATVQEALESAGSPEAPNNPWRWYMRRDLPHVLEVDALCVLPGWQKSKGASLEVHVAKAIGLPIYVLKNGSLIPQIEVLGLSGWARSGKDTIADYLVETEGYVKVSFAQPIKDALEALNPEITIEGAVYTIRQMIGLGWESLKDLSPSVRPLLQRMGTEVGREMFGQDFWVEAALSRVPDGSKVVFADVRFPNEANAIRNLGGEIWRIERDGVGPANDHISEHALNDYKFDRLILNDSNVESLYAQVEEIRNG